MILEKMENNENSINSIENARFLSSLYLSAFLKDSIVLFDDKIKEILKSRGIFVENNYINDANTIERIKRFIGMDVDSTMMVLPSFSNKEYTNEFISCILRKCIRVIMPKESAGFMGILSFPNLKFFISELYDNIEIIGTINYVANKIQWEGYQFMELVGKYFSMDEYIDYVAVHDILNFSSKDLTMKFKRICPEAISPTKKSYLDTGFDIAIIREIEKIGDLTIFGTGIIVEPPIGYYFDLVARSSLSKLGYIIPISVGIIDSTYRGELKVPLYKINPNAKDIIILPQVIVQLVPRKTHIMKVKEVESFIQTERGDGGFGSTDSKERKK